MGGQCWVDEVACPDAGPCTPGACDSQSGCTTVSLPDGSACETADPCTPGVCTANACVTDPASLAGAVDHAATVSRCVLAATARTGRIRAEAIFRTPAAFDPAQTGVALEVRRGGRLLYEATLPGSALRMNPSRTVFRYAASGPRALGPAARGLHRLVLRLAGDTVTVLVAGASPGLAGTTDTSALGLVLRAGETCVRDLGVLCAQPHVRSRR